MFDEPWMIKTYQLDEDMLLTLKNEIEKVKQTWTEYSAATRNAVFDQFLPPAERSSETPNSVARAWLSMKTADRSLQDAIERERSY